MTKKVLFVEEKKKKFVNAKRERKPLEPRRRRCKGWSKWFDDNGSDCDGKERKKRGRGGKGIEEIDDLIVVEKDDRRRRPDERKVVVASSTVDVYVKALESVGLEASVAYHDGYKAGDDGRICTVRHSVSGMKPSEFTRRTVLALEAFRVAVTEYASGWKKPAGRILPKRVEGKNTGTAVCFCVAATSVTTVAMTIHRDITAVVGMGTETTEAVAVTTAAATVGSTAMDLAAVTTAVDTGGVCMAEAATTEGKATTEAADTATTEAADTATDIEASLFFVPSHHCPIDPSFFLLALLPDIIGRRKLPP